MADPFLAVLVLPTESAERPSTNQPLGGYLVQKLNEHRGNVVSMIEAVDVGVQVALEILGADDVVNAVDTPLGVAPEPFDVVGMGAARHVLLGTVDHGFVGIAKARQVIVGGACSSVYTVAS